MGVHVHTKSFKSGNSVTVRFARSLGLEAGVPLRIEREGDGYRLTPLHDAAEGKRRLQQMLAELDAIGPVGEIERRDPDIFPDRPGLYD